MGKRHKRSPAGRAGAAGQGHRAVNAGEGGLHLPGIVPAGIQHPRQGPLLQQEDPAAEVEGQAGIVEGGQPSRTGGGQMARRQPQDLPPAGGVQGALGLVQDPEAGVRRQGPGQEDQLLLALAQGLVILPGPVLQPSEALQYQMS